MKYKARINFFLATDMVRYFFTSFFINIPTLTFTGYVQGLSIKFISVLLSLPFFCQKFDEACLVSDLSKELPSLSYNLFGPYSCNLKTQVFSTHPSFSIFLVSIKYHIYSVAL